MAACCACTYKATLRLASEHTCIYTCVLPTVAAQAAAESVYACTRWPGTLKKILLSEEGTAVFVVHMKLCVKDGCLMQNDC